MPKKKRISAVSAVGSEPAAAQESNETQLAAVDLLEMMRHEHASELAKVRLQLAQAQDRAVRLEITQAAKAAAEGLRHAQDSLSQTRQQQSTFAQALADRYHFQWSTHTFCPDTGIVRRVTED